MAKIDVKKQFPAAYKITPRDGVVVRDIPPLRFLMIDGEGPPGNDAYTAAVEALFSVSYATKFAVKKGPSGVDYGVMPLEGLWWADDHDAYLTDRRDEWKWTLMILQPDIATDELLRDTMQSVQAKKGLTAIDHLRIETLEEGRCGQVLHIGPFTEEGPTVERLHAVIAERGTLRGKHHEVYLSDVRRADPARWRTIIRQPMTAAPAV